MGNYKYSETEINKMLFTELVIASADNEDIGVVFYNEIIRRLKFCEFEEIMIQELIAYELEILKSTKKRYESLLINKKWWLDQENVQKVLSLPYEQYLMYYNGEMSEKALTNSEIVSLYDEALFISEYKNNFDQSIIDECEILSKKESEFNLRDQFIHRIDYIYKREMNKNYNLVIFNKAMRFLQNEMHIIFIEKYNYKIKEEDKWIPYTNEYFKKFEN